MAAFAQLRTWCGARHSALEEVGSMATVAQYVRAITIACLGVPGLLSASETSPKRSDAEVLKNEVLPTLELLDDPSIGGTVKPYTDCYSTAVAASSASTLENDRAVQLAEQAAQTACKSVKQTSTMKADEALAGRFPNLSPEARTALLGRVRRQAALFALISKYQRSGRAPVFQHYLERIGREARAGHLVVMLSGE
jgi:hypothetical protein